MDKLPPELLHKIFIHLNFHSKLVCLTICRRWWHVLDQCSLFYSMEFQNEDDYFNRSMDMFERLPDRAAQVEELTISLKAHTSFNRRKLFDIFPNAHKMELSSKWPDYGNNHFMQDIDLTHRKAGIEFLSDFHHCELVSQLLYSKLGGQLQTLYLSYLPFLDTPTILSQLKDLPVLKTLSLASFDLEIASLELLHKNIPSIQYLALDNLCLSGRMPFEIVPASSITKLKFGGGYPVEFEMLCQAYQYMTKKYANVTEVDFENIELDDYEPSERKYVYLNGYLDFLKLIGPTQQELTLDFVPDGIDPSEVLGAVDPKIKQIWLYCCESETILRDLSRSNQSKYVQALILTESNIDSIHAIKDMTCLTELIVRFSGEDGPPVDLVGCLEACPPSIKFFAITYDRMVVKPLNILLESIETLEIRSRDLTTELGDIISFRFPNLVKLILDFQYLQDTNITLKSPRLQHVTFSKNSYALENNSEYGLSFKSPAQSEPKHYICDSQQTREVEGNLIEGLPTLSIEYFTNKILDLSKDIQVIPC